MADTLESIYLNTAIGATELDDGEHTIVTTDANTSYVIKDMLVNNTSNLTNTYLELNGFNVGSISSNATGSLIVPPNSTLKIKTYDYPYSFITQEQYATDTSRYGHYEKSIVVNGNATIIESTSTTQLMYQENQVIDMMYVNSGGTEYIFSATHDDNSVQHLRYNKISPGAESQRAYGNYVAHGLSNDTSLGPVGLMTSSNTLYGYDLDADPTGGSSFVIRSGFSPYPTSSYPRGTYSHGYLWFIPSNSYATQLYGINIVTGNMVRYTGLTSEGVAGSSKLHFTVSLDPETNKFIFWRQNASNQMQVCETNETKAELDAKTSDYSGTVTEIKARGTLSVYPSITYMSQGVLTPQADGNIGFVSTTGTFTIIDKELNVIEQDNPIDVKNLNINGKTVSAFENFYSSTTKTSTAEEIAAAGVGAPSFGMQILGVKSEAL